MDSSIKRSTSQSHPGESTSFLIKLITSFACILIAYSATQGIFDVFTVNGSGLDDNLIYFQNYSFNNNIVFGRDTLNTYGPLGYLLHPIAYNNNFNLAILFRLTIWVASLILLYQITAKSNKTTPFATLFFAVTLYLAFDYGFIFGTEHKNNQRILHNTNVTLFIILVTYAALISEKTTQNIIFTLLSFSSLFFTVTKFQYGITLTLCTAFCLIASWAKGRRQFTRNALFTLTGLILATPLYLILFHDVSTIIQFIRGSLEITSGYSESVSLQGPSYQLYAAALLMTAFASTILTNRTNSPYIPIYLIGLLFCLLFFKHAFTRHDEHGRAFFLVFPILASATMLVSMSKTSTITLSLASLLSFTVLFHSTDALRLNTKDYASTFSERLISKLQHPKGIFDISSISTAHHNAGDNETKLCAEIVSKVGQNKTSLWTSKIMYIDETNINFTPFYIYQEYNNYTPYLDSATRKRLKDKETRPKHVIFHFGTIDGRNPFIDSPKTLDTLFKEYTTTELCDMFLLTCANNDTPQTQYTTIHTAQIHPDETLAIPKSNNDLFMTINLQYTIAGRIKTILRHLPPIYIILTDETNTERRVRISPKTLNYPFLINNIPCTNEHFVKRMRREPYPQTTKIKITGPGLKQFKRDIDVSLYESQPN